MIKDLGLAYDVPDEFVFRFSIVDEQLRYFFHFLEGSNQLTQHQQTEFVRVILPEMLLKEGSKTHLFDLREHELFLLIFLVHDDQNIVEFRGNIQFEEVGHLDDDSTAIVELYLFIYGETRVELHLCSLVFDGDDLFSLEFDAKLKENLL